MGYWNYEPVGGTEIFNDEIGSGFEDLDVSSIVGSQKVICHLTVFVDVNNFVISFRPKGEVYTVGFGDSVDHGVHRIWSVEGVWIGVLVATDSNGVLQVKGPVAGADCQINLEGWFEPSIASGMIDAGKAITTSYADVDCSSLVTGRGIVLARYRRTAGTGAYILANKPKGQAGEYLSTNGYQLGCCHGANATSTTYESLFCPTDANSIIQAKISGTTQTLEIYLHGGEDEKFEWNDTQLFDGTPTRNTWLELDSGLAIPALAVLELTYTLDDGWRKNIGFRRKGDGREFAAPGAINTPLGTSQRVGLSSDTGICVVPLDSAGKFEYYMYSQYATTCNWEIRLLGHIPIETFPPEVTNEHPTGTTKVRPDTMGCTILDEHGLDMSTVDVTVSLSDGRSFSAIAGGSFQTGFDGQLVEIGGANPTRVDVIIRDWPNDIADGNQVQFSIDAENVVGKTL